MTKSDMLSNVKRLHDLTRSRVMTPRAEEVSELREEIEKLTDVAEAKDQGF